MEQAGRLKIVLLCLCLYAVHWTTSGGFWKLLGFSRDELRQNLEDGDDRLFLSPPARPVSTKALPAAPPPAVWRPPPTVPPGPPPGRPVAPPAAALPGDGLRRKVEAPVPAPPLPQVATAAPAAPQPVQEPMWLFCAAQWQECICEGTVRWGNKDKWLEVKPEAGKRTVSVVCSIQKLPDVLPGDDGKHCECAATPGTPFFDSINPSFLPESMSGSRPHQVASCEIFEESRGLGLSARQQWEAVEAFCSGMWRPGEGEEAGELAMPPKLLRSLMRAWVEPRFWENYRRLYNSSGWLPRGFVNYYAGAPGGKHAGMTEELIKSVHLFSAEPIVVVHFGFFTPSKWTPEHFPRLVLLNAPPQPPNAKRSFHFNKMRAFLLARVATGVELDSDQFVAPGVDTMFSLTEREVTKDYPLPILPAHFYPFSRSDDNLGGPALWKRYCPNAAGSCKWQTARWGHAHPTWTFWALPFWGRWLRRQLRDETLPARHSGQMPALRVVDVKEDEDLMNVGTWEEGGSKQWCKFDLPDPVEFDTLLAAKGEAKVCKKGMCNDVVPDKTWNKMGVAKVFFTGHHAVDPATTKRYVEALARKKSDRDLAPPVLFRGMFYKDGEALRETHPKINCLI